MARIFNNFYEPRINADKHGFFVLKNICVYLCLSVVFITTFINPAYATRPSVNFPVVKLQSLDKITARTETFEARVGSTVKFGPLYIKVQACRENDPLERPESAAFLQVWEIVADRDSIAANALADAAEEGKPQWVFSGWMFASSPALSSMDHPVYDVWVLDCLEDQKPEKAEDELAQDEIPAVPEGDAPAASEGIQREEL